MLGALLARLGRRRDVKTAHVLLETGEWVRAIPSTTSTADSAQMDTKLSAKPSPSVSTPASQDVRCPDGKMPPMGDGPARLQEEVSAFGPVSSEMRGFSATQGFHPSGTASPHTEAVKTFCRDGTDTRHICNIHPHGRTKGSI